MFELKTKTPAVITSVTPRIEKHGDDNVPAISLGLKITGPNTLLDLLCPGLRDVLYKAVDGQDQLPGVEQSTPLLRSRAIERIKVKMPTMEGWILIVEHGIDDDTQIELHSCKVDKVFAEPFEGGSCEISFRVGTSDVDERYMGELAMKLGSEVPITLLAPVAADPAIDGTRAAFDADHPSASGSLFDDDAPSQDATDAFVRSAHDDNGDGDGFELDDVSDAEGLDMHGVEDGDDDASSELTRHAGAAPARKQAGAPVQYRDAATGQTWSGRGMKPAWLRQELEAGKTLADFEVHESAGVEASRRRMRANQVNVAEPS